MLKALVHAKMGRVGPDSMSKCVRTKWKAPMHNKVNKATWILLSLSNLWYWAENVLKYPGRSKDCLIFLLYFSSERIHSCFHIMYARLPFHDFISNKHSILIFLINP